MPRNEFDDPARNGAAPIARSTSRPGPEPRSATLLRLAHLFASADGAVAGGRYEDLRGLLGRISLALTMARSAERNAPAELRSDETAVSAARSSAGPRFSR